MEAGLVLAGMREQQGLTQGELSERSGISQQYISRIERGAVKPRMRTLQRLAEAMDTTVETLREKAPQPLATEATMLVPYYGQVPADIQHFQYQHKPIRMPLETLNHLVMPIAVMTRIEVPAPMPEEMLLSGELVVINRHLLTWPVGPQFTPGMYLINDGDVVALHYVCRIEDNVLRIVDHHGEYERDLRHMQYLGAAVMAQPQPRVFKTAL